MSQSSPAPRVGCKAPGISVGVSCLQFAGEQKVFPYVGEIDQGHSGVDVEVSNQDGCIRIIEPDMCLPHTVKSQTPAALPECSVDLILPRHNPVCTTLDQEQPAVLQETLE